MAEFESIVEGVQEVIEEAEGGIEELSEEAQEALEGEIEEANTVIEELSETESKLETFISKVESSLGKLVSFTVKNVAIGAILWGVNVALSKLLSHAHTETHKRMSNVIKALSDVIRAESQINQKALEWMKAHKDETIVLDDFEVPMESILFKFFGQLDEVRKPIQCNIFSLMFSITAVHLY